MAYNFTMIKQGWQPILKDKRVLVTGHTGFKGTWLTLLLEEFGVDVSGISLEPERGSLFESLTRRGGIHEYFVDVREKNNLEIAVKEIKPQVVFHLAAQPLVLDSYQDPIGTFETNVMGSANLFDILVKLESTEVIAAVTTDKVYENKNLSVRFKENDSLRGSDPYSASKVGTESAINAWRKISQMKGGPKIISLRAGNVIGGGDTAANRLLPDLVRGFIEGKNIEIRNPDSTRPWQHVLDPLYGYILAVEHGLRGENHDAFNFGPPEPSMRVRDVVDVAMQAWSSSSKVDFLTAESNSEAITLELNSEYATQELNWSPTWSQKEAIVSTVNWWKETTQTEMTPLEACKVDLERLLVPG